MVLMKNKLTKKGRGRTVFKSVA